MSVSPAIFASIKHRLGSTPSTADEAEMSSNCSRLSYGQRLLWHHHSAGSAHSLAVEWRLNALDPARFQSALNSMLERHPALRMSFSARSSDTEPNVRIALPKPVPFIRLASIEDGREFCFLPFVLDHAPLMRAGWMPNGDGAIVWLSWHHLIFDGWSYQIFVDEFLQCYSGAALPPPQPYRLTEGSEQFGNDAAIPTPVSFATRPPQRPPRPLRRNRCSLLAFDHAAAAAHRVGVGIFEWLLGSLFLLFSRLGDQTVVRLQIADAGRGRELRSIGPYSRLIGVQVEVDDRSSIHEFLQLTSLRLAEALSAGIDAAAHGSAVVTFQNLPQAPRRAPLQDDQALAPPHIIHEHAIYLQVDKSDINLIWDQACDAVSDTAAVSLIHAWQYLLQQWINPETRLHSLHWQTHFIQNTPGIDHLEGFISLDDRFRSMVEFHGEKSALECGDRCLSYSELNRNAAMLAERLLAAGIQSGQVLLIDVPDPICYVVSILAAIRLGTVYVPCDTRHTRKHVQGWCEPYCAAVLYNSGDWVIELLDCDAPKQVDAGYWMFTSGSTGAPKLTRISERSITQLALMDGITRIHADDRVAMIAPVGFDASTFEIWATLLNGATLVAPVAAPSVSELADLIERQRISAAFLGSGWFELLVDYKLSALRAMRLVLSGGDVMSPPHAKCFRAAGYPALLINVYGPTENTTFTTAHLVNGDETPVPLGLELPGRIVHLLDRCGQPLPDGLIGEAWLGGDGVMLGEHDHRVVVHPILGRLYRSGDRMWREHGRLHFAGRIDRQVKWRGFRVHLDFVEAALRADPAVLAARVRLEPGVSNRLVAEIELCHAASLDDLRERMAYRWPATMLPSDYRIVQRVVLESGKTRMVPAGKGIRTAHSPVSQDTPLPLTIAEDGLESRILEILRDALAPVKIDRDQDFYDRGGDSLMALRVLAELNRCLGRRLDLEHFNTGPSAAQLAIRYRQAPLEIDDGELFVELTDHRHGVCAYLIPGGHGGDAELALYRTSFAGLPIRLVGVRIVKLDAGDLNDRASQLARRLQSRESGPIRLLGECIGGVLAQETARSLPAARLLLLDTWPMTEAGVRHYLDCVRPRQLRREVKHLRRLAWADLGKVALGHISPSLVRGDYRSDVWETLRRVHTEWQCVIARVGQPRNPEEIRGHAVIEQALAHRTQSGGRAELIAPAFSRRHGIAQAWANLMELRVHAVPGDHGSYLRQHRDSTREIIMKWWCGND